MKIKNLIVLGIVAVIVFGLSGFVFYQFQTQFAKKKSEEAALQKAPDIVREISPLQLPDDKAVPTGFVGKVLAGSTSPYIAFNQKDFDSAKEQGKTIFLNFYANWSPINQGEEPYIRSGFDVLTAKNIVGFRVNYSDNDTDQDEKKLARDFNVNYEHTKIILKNDKELLRSEEVWDKSRFLKEVNNAIAN